MSLTIIEAIEGRSGETQFTNVNLKWQTIWFWHIVTKPGYWAQSEYIRTFGILLKSLFN